MLNKIIYIISAVFFVTIVGKNFHLLDSVPNDLLKAKLGFLLLALFLQVLKHLVMAYNFYANFKKIDINFSYFEVLKLTFVYIYLCVATPFVGAGGVIAFIDYAKSKGISKMKVASSTFLALLQDFLSFFIIIVLALILFSSSISDFPVTQIIGFLIVGFLMLFLVFVGIFRHNLLVKFFKLVQKLANFVSFKVHKKVHFDESWAERNIDMAHECFIDIRKDPWFYIKIIGVSFSAHVLNIATLAAVAFSFKEAVSISKMTSIYVVLNTLESFSPTPNGIGWIESLVPEYMSGYLGFDAGNSLIVITIFRVIYFYLPLLLGFYLSYSLWKKLK